MTDNDSLIFFTYHFPVPERAGSFRPWVEAGILSNMGYDVTVITSGVDYITGQSEIQKGSSDVEWKQGMKIVRVKTVSDYRSSKWRRFLNYLIYAIRAFFAACREKKPARIFVGSTSYFITVSVYLYRALKARGVPYIIDERDLFVESAISLGVMKRRMLASLMLAWDRFFRSRAETIFAISDTMKKELVEMKVPPEKIEVVPSIDITLMRDDMEKDYSFPVKFFEERRSFIIAYTGSFGMANDVITILKAAQLVDKENPDIGFVLVGGGDKFDSYMEYIEKFGLHNTRIYPPIGREVVRNFLQHASVCVHALRAQKVWNMALSSKIFDYLLFRKPVLFCGEGEIKDMIENIGAGKCVPPEDPRALADAVKELYEAKDHLGDMGKRGYEFVVKNYPAEKITGAFRRRFQYGASK